MEICLFIGHSDKKKRFSIIEKKVMLQLIKEKVLNSLLTETASLNKFKLQIMPHIASLKFICTFPLYLESFMEIF